MMPAFDPTRYGPVFGPLLAERRLPELGPGQPNLAARPLLDAVRIETAFSPHAVCDRAMASACLAGLWLYHDFLEESHEISQGIDTLTGSYWHGIMHRREPDPDNAKYWFRRVGEHPVFEPLAAFVRDLPGRTELIPFYKRWDPFAFIDLCEACREGKEPHEMLCRQIQQREWELLFDHCYRQAV